MFINCVFISVQLYICFVHACKCVLNKTCSSSYGGNKSIINYCTYLYIPPLFILSNSALTVLVLVYFTRNCLVSVRSD